MVLKHLSEGGLFSVAVNGHDVVRGKPEPEVFLAAAEKLNIPPENCVVIEDAPVGLEAAHRAGIPAVALTGTATREQLKDAELIVDSLKELTPEILKNLINSRTKN